MGLLNDFPPQDVIYGLWHANIADQLTVENWHEKAVMRVLQKDSRLWLYIWVRDVGSHLSPRFVVRCESRNELPFEVEFQTASLQAALDYVNGFGAYTDLSRCTRPARPTEWPQEQRPGAWVGSVVPARGA